MNSAPAKTRKPGYTKELLVLPFDHRGSFQTKMFGIEGTPTAEQTQLIGSFKTVVYEGYERALAAGLSKDVSGVLVDEQFGQEVIRRAKDKNVTLCIPAEKSGQDEFDFEHGDGYQAHIEKTDPEFIKVLVRYNPDGEPALNQRQSKRLADLSRFILSSKRFFMFELLVPATDEQLKKCGGDKHKFDLEMRPQLMVRAIQELQNAGVEADIWKVEGLDREEDFEKICKVAKAGGRDDVGCIVLGRGENEAKVREWLSVGAHVKGVVGFAVGRTIFWEPLKALKEKKATREETVERIAQSFKGFCDLWAKERRT